MLSQLTGNETLSVHYSIPAQVVDSIISQNIFTLFVPVVKIHTTPHNQQIQLLRKDLGGVKRAKERPSRIYLRFCCFPFKYISVQICFKIKHGVSDSLLTGC